MCGKGKGKTDITANQFLDTFGYSTKSGDSKTKICSYNRLLEKEHIIKIEGNTLEDGKRRNTYTFLDL